MLLDIRKQSWVFTLPAAGVAAAYVWFCFLPGKASIDELHRQLNEKQVFAANYGQIIDQSKRVQVQLDETQRYIVGWEQATPKSGEMARLYAEIAEVAKSAGVATTKFSPEPAQKLTKLQRLSVRLGCQGEFAKVCCLLSGLEQLPDHVWVDDLTLEAGGKNGEVLACELSLVVFAKNSGNSD